MRPELTGKEVEERAREGCIDCLLMALLFLGLPIAIALVFFVGKLVIHAN